MDMPMEVLDKVSEMSPGGFVLFIINERGSPNVFSMYDSDISALGLQRFIDLWSSATLDKQSDKIADIMEYDSANDDFQED